MVVFTIRPNSKTAGLSPVGDTRTEIFFGGCKMAREGNPCPGCFNSDLWPEHPVGSIEMTAQEIFKNVEEIGNKYVTIVGGEPLDQYDELGTLLLYLYIGGYHVVLITHHLMGEIMHAYPLIIECCNVIIDGKFDPTRRIFDESKNPGVHHVIGSSNQRFWAKVSDGSFENINKNDDLRPYYESLIVDSVCAASG